MQLVKQNVGLEPVSMAVPQRDLNNVTADSERAEISAAIDDLAEEVARLALHVKLSLAVAAGAEAERAAELLRAAAGCTTGALEPQSRRQAFSDDKAQASPMAEVASTKMSLQPNGWIDDAGNSEMEFMCDLCAARSDLAKGDAVLAEPKGASRGAENAIAARVLELHDRLGGFIKPNGQAK